MDSKKKDKYRVQLIDFDERQRLESKVKALGEFPTDPTITKVLKEKFLKKNVDGTPESPEDRFAAIAVELATANRIYDSDANIEEFASEVYQGLINQEIVFNTPLNLNFARFVQTEEGIEQYSQLGSACFVIPMDDTIKRGREDKTAIFETVACAADVQKAGGGTGFSGARLRAKSTQIKGLEGEVRKIRWDSTTGNSSGYLSFFKVLNEATHATTQGNSRRGANMGIQRIDHPDFLEHMYAKLEEGEFKEFNFSMGLTLEFMEAVLNNDYYELQNPIGDKKYNVRADEIASQAVFEERVSGKVDASLPSMYIEEGTDNIINGFTGKKIGQTFGGKAKIHARTVYENITQLMHKNGEPGVVFLDRINAFNPTPNLGDVESTNPCGEQPLLPFEACNLAALNLAKFVIPGKINYKTGKVKPGKINYAKMGQSIDLLIRSLDNAIDISDFPLPQITKAVQETRKIGVGMTAIAEAAMIARIPLNSTEGIAFCEDAAKFLSERCRKYSMTLAKERGVFPAFKGSLYDPKSEAHKNIPRTALNFKGKVRNAARTSYAPNGTSGRLVGQKSQGIEPLFALKYSSNVLGRKEALIDYCKDAIGVLKQERFYSEELIKAVVEGNGGSFKLTNKTPEKIQLYDKNKKPTEEIQVRSVIEAVPQVLRDILVISSDISPKEHIAIQAAFQKYCDSGVSKTVNCPKETTVEEISDLILDAYKNGCKGFTVYRSGSRDVEVLIAKGVTTEGDVVKYNRPALQESFILELPVGSPNQNERRKVFSHVAYDSAAKRVNSVFQSASWGDSESVRHMISETRAWSKILKNSNGNPSTIESLLADIPKGEHRVFGKIGNDTTQNAMLKTLYVFKFLTKGYTDYSDETINDNKKLIYSGKVELKSVIETKGNFKLEQGGLPAIFPDESDMLIHADYGKRTEECPSCNTKKPDYGIKNGCLVYKCCDYSACGGD